MASDLRLNLARKWRSQSFEQVVGQELPVRMLKNSLYRECYFPVYLFCGQRGCGKTTTARLFAAALGCQQLDAFRSTPQEVIVPCRTCDSCLQMRAGTHPDFIEIDAASNTGVDNVRQLIESSSLLPLLGRKRIYLIDEAHMLSKAAFNALLKILEEPPSSALFILATTDPGKVIDTVRSRCFQLFFRPVSFEPLCNHLEWICDQEKIRYERAGLEQIVRETSGSVRDALNMLEQVRFSGGAVTKDGVLCVLGHIADEQLALLAQDVLTGSPVALLARIEQLRLEQFSAEFIWRRLMECVRAALWCKYDVVPEEFVGDEEAVRQISARGSLKQLYGILDELYQGEQVFARTTEQHGFMKMVLLRLCTKFSGSPGSGEGGATPAAAQVAVSSHDEMPTAGSVPDEEDEGDLEEEEEIEEDDAAVRWGRFLAGVAQLNDQLLHSVFTQAQRHEYDADAQRLSLVFSSDFVLFGDTIAKSEAQWLTFAKKVYGDTLKVTYEFSGQAQPRTPRTMAPQTASAPAPVPAGASRQAPVNSGLSRGNSYGRRIDVSDAAKWPKTNLVLSHFPGVVTQLESRSDG